MKVQPKSLRQKELALRQTPPGKSRKFEKEVGQEAGRGGKQANLELYTSQR